MVLLKLISMSIIITSIILMGIYFGCIIGRLLSETFIYD